jgi:hypothetical protein
MVPRTQYSLVRQKCNDINQARPKRKLTRKVFREEKGCPLRKFQYLGYSQVFRKPQGPALRWFIDFSELPYL